MNISEQLNQDSKEYGIGSTNFFKFQNGDNRIRLLTAGSVIATHFFGKGQKAHTCYGIEKGCPWHGDKAPRTKDGGEQKPSIKYTCYVLADGKIQLADLPYSVIKEIGLLQTNEDYSFDSFPMPYDVTVKFNKESGSPNDMYKVIPSPKRIEIPDDIKEQLVVVMSKLTPEQSVEKKKVAQRTIHDSDGTTQKRVEEFRASVDTAPVNSEPVMQYPDEEINPDDIPF